MEKEITLLKLSEPLILNKDHINVEFQLINYYLQKDLIVQVVLLTREFLVNYLSWQKEFKKIGVIVAHVI